MFLALLGTLALRFLAQISLGNSNQDIPSRNVSRTLGVSSRSSLNPNNSSLLGNNWVDGILFITVILYRLVQRWELYCGRKLFAHSIFFVLGTPLFDHFHESGESICETSKPNQAGIQTEAAISQTLRTIAISNVVSSR